MNRATFYFDLGSPYAYLAAERISGLFTEAGLEQPEWQPCLTLPPRSNVMSRMVSPDSALADSNCPDEKFRVG